MKNNSDLKFVGGASQLMSQRCTSVWNAKNPDDPISGPSKARKQEIMSQYDLAYPTKDEIDYRNKMINTFNMDGFDANRATNDYAKKRGWGGRGMNLLPDNAIYSFEEAKRRTQQKRKAKKRAAASETKALDSMTKTIVEPSTSAPTQNVSSTNEAPMLQLMHAAMSEIMEVVMCEFPKGSAFTMDIKDTDGSAYSISRSVT